MSCSEPALHIEMARICSLKVTKKPLNTLERPLKKVILEPKSLWLWLQ